MKISQPYLRSREWGWRVARLCESDGYEPIYYHHYDSEKGDWIYQVVTPREASHIRHRLTGKIYRANQRRRAWRHTWAVDAALAH